MLNISVVQQCYCTDLWRKSYCDWDWHSVGGAVLWEQDRCTVVTVPSLLVALTVLCSRVVCNSHHVLYVRILEVLSSFSSIKYFVYYLQQYDTYILQKHLKYRVPRVLFRRSQRANRWVVEFVSKKKLFWLWGGFLFLRFWWQLL